MKRLAALVIAFGLALLSLTVATGADAYRYTLPENQVGENAVLYEWFSSIEAEIGSKTGPAGPEGKQGPEGREGKEGKQGLEGKAGLEGKSGTRGERGETGATGARGPEGPEGKESETTKSKLTSLETRVTKLETEVKEDGETIIYIQKLLKIG